MEEAKDHFPNGVALNVYWSSVKDKQLRVESLIQRLIRSNPFANLVKEARYSTGTRLGKTKQSHQKVQFDQSPLCLLWSLQ